MKILQVLMAFAFIVFIESKVNAQATVQITADETTTVQIFKWTVDTDRTTLLSEFDQSKTITIHPDDVGMFVLKAGGKKRMFCVENNTSVQIVVGDEITVKGSTCTDELLAYENFRKSDLEENVLTVRKEIAAAQKAKDYSLVAELSLKEQRNYKQHIRNLMQFEQENLTLTLAHLYASKRWLGDEYLTYLNTLVSDLQEEHPTANLTAQVNQTQLLEKVSIGYVAPEVRVENDSLVQFSANKITVIDFWASWCGPCRREHPHLKEVYAKYKGQGLGIIGLALERSKTAMDKAVEKDGLPWYNYTSGTMYKDANALNYQIKAVPTNYIIDQKGKILAKRLDWQELEAFLKDYFTD